MKEEILFRACAIRDRIEELKRMQVLLEDKAKPAWLRVSHNGAGVRISDDMRVSMLKMCIEERVKLTKELEEL